MRQLRFLAAGLLLSSPASAQGVLPAIEGAFWGSVAGMPAAVIAVPWLVDRVASCSTNSSDKVDACAVATGVVLSSFLAAGAYIGASEKERLPSVRRGALAGFLVGAAVGSVVVAATDKSLNGLVVLMASVSVGVIAGALSYDRGESHVSPAIMPVLRVGF